MQPNMASLVLTTMVSLGIEDNEVAGDILVALILSLMVSLIMVEVMALLGSSPAATMDSGRTITILIVVHVAPHRESTTSWRPSP